MEKDIEKRIMHDFGTNASEAVILMEAFETKNKLSPRVSRCIIHLAEGDIDKLKNNIKVAECDWRDVIMWAEPVPLCYNKPFDDQ